MSGILIIFSLALISVLFIRISSVKSVPSKHNIELILAALPQTQCGQCDYPGCRPYAEAIIQGKTDINRCTPGGENTIKALTSLLGHSVVRPLSAIRASEKQTAVAVINEDECIGCVKCIKVCPTDAIVGANKQMHSIIAKECTGCSLCIDPCPMDCISLQTLVKHNG